MLMAPSLPVTSFPFSMFTAATGFLFEAGMGLGGGGRAHGGEEVVKADLSFAGGGGSRLE